MGMYTELVISARIKNERDAVEVLKHMAGEGDRPDPLPDHPLFSTPGWTMLFQCSSYYFVPRSMVKFEYDDIGEYWVLISRADLKNYNGEIEKFIDWVRPHLVDRSDNDMIGYSRYEESREPTIHYANETPAT